MRTKEEILKEIQKVFDSSEIWLSSGPVVFLLNLEGDSCLSSDYNGMNEIQRGGELLLELAAVLRTEGANNG